MKNTYASTKKELDRIRDEYGCKGEVIFRTALQCLMEYGTDNLLDDWNYEHLKGDINERHDDAEAEGKTLWTSRNFELAILECAREIAKVETYSLLVYIQKEVWLSNEGGIDYDRAVQLLKRCMSWIEDDKYTLFDALSAFEDIGIDDDEIEMLGFAYMLDVKEEEEND